MFMRQLEYLVTLAREKHFARAAELCSVSQPALSAGIRHLEEELGVSIVQRGKRYVGLSPDGERILEWAKQTLAAWEGLRQEASIARTELKGALRCGAIPTTIPILPLLTGALRASFPGVNHVLRSLTSEEIMRGLDEFELDLGVTYLEDQRLEGFKVLPLFRERYVLLAESSTAAGGVTSMSWSDAAGLPLCLLTPNMQNRRIINAAFRRAKAQPNVVVETNSMFALCSHVSRAHLFTIVPHSLLSVLDMHQGLSAIDLTPELTRATGLIAIDQEPMSPIVAAAWATAKKIDLTAVFESVISTAYQPIGLNT
jgi:DNA-binding transcriptional LysR family regulator